MKKLFAVSIILISLLLMFCKEDLPVETNVEFYKFSGKVYTTVDTQKVYLENVKVILEGDTTLTDTEGLFSFDKIREGKYSVTFLYLSPADLFYSKVVEIEILNEDVFEEYLLYETELITEDIIYVKDNNYYFRSKNGDTQQITYTNDRIEDEVSFFNDGNSFFYISVAGENHYSINFISLNPTMYHRVIYETDEQIQDLRISEDETKICFIQYDKILRLDINSKEAELLFNLPTARQVVVFSPPYRKHVLFYDCERIAYLRIDRQNSGEEWNYLVIKNFITGDSTIVTSTGEYYIRELNISPNDELIYYIISFDGAPEGKLWSLTTGSIVKNNITGEGMGYFSECGNYFYGIEFNWNCYGSSDACNWAKVYKLPSLEEIILESNLNYSTGFNTLSFSEKENKFLYSLNGDIKIYDLNTKRSYNFMATNADEHGARFVNQN